LSGDDDKGKLLQTTISALEHFGDVKVLSSPKIMSLNNQTSIMKVVDNLVYFTIEVETEESTVAGQGDTTTSETEIHTVPVGFVMSVTPQISQSGQVTLNLRPTISRVIGKARDPNPVLAQLNIVNEVPMVQVREMESTLSIRSGDTAIMGGLMQDDIQQADNSVPVLSDIPYLGRLFEYKEDIAQKSELVIFLRPIIVENASLQGDLKSFQPFLPKQHDDNRVKLIEEPES
jgi:general secretion pathway protein D